MKRLLLILGALLAALLLLGAYFATRGDTSMQTSLDVAEAMGGDTTGYARARTPRTFQFPEDHGPHPAYRTEWWYYTGNLNAEDGRHFGFQFTLFRVALAPPDSAAEARPSDWATNQLYMGHFAVTDVAGETFYAFERFSRGAAGLAGAQAQPFRVWLEDWETAGAGDERGDVFPMRVRASQEGVAIDLTMEPAKPMVLQGDRGLDQKGKEEGNASYYFAFTRLATEGTVTVGGTRFDVRGLAWMDREWSTSALDEDQAGWDWFALQLANGYDLMYYQIRQEDGTPSPFTSGALVAPDGEKLNLEEEEVTLEVLDTWESPTGATYPARWRLRIPAQRIDLTLVPYLADQELTDVSVRYWEGAVRVEGTMRGAPVSGNGYVEMTGYGENAAQRAS